MTQKTQPFKRGDTFSLNCIFKVEGVATAITTQTFRAQLRTTSGALIEELSSTIPNQSTNVGHFYLRPVDQINTKNWPAPGTMLCDIEVISGGTVVSTETFEIPILIDQTR